MWIKTTKREKPLRFSVFKLGFKPWHPVDREGHATTDAKRSLVMEDL